MTLGIMLDDHVGAEPLFCNKVLRSFIKFKAPSQSVIDSSRPVCFEQPAKREEGASLQRPSPECTIDTHTHTHTHTRTVQLLIFRDTGYWNIHIDLKHTFISLLKNVKDPIISFRDMCFSPTALSMHHKVI